MWIVRKYWDIVYKETNNEEKVKVAQDLLK